MQRGDVSLAGQRTDRFSLSREIVSESDIVGAIMVGLKKAQEEAKTRERARTLILHIAEEIRRSYQPEKIILFGSYAYGRPTRDSDIDLFIVKDTPLRKPDRFSEVSKLIFGLLQGISVEPHVYTPTEVRERLALGDPFVKEVLEKGEVLYDRAQELDAGMVPERPA